MRVLDLAGKDLLQIVRDWKAGFFLLIMPVTFTLLFGYMFGGVGGGETDTRLPVGYLDVEGGPAGDALLDLLAESQVLRLVPVEDQQGLDRQIEEGDLAAAVIVPPGYNQQVSGGDGMPLPVLVDPGTQAGISVQNEIQAAVGRLQAAARTARITTDLYEQAQTFPDSAARQAFAEQVFKEAAQAWSDPPASLKTRLGVAEEEPQTMTNAFAQSSPGMMAQFAIAGLIAAAEVLVLERKTRALQRLLTTAISRVEVLLGHFLAMFMMIATQFVLLLVFGQLFLELDYFGQPVATLLMTVTTAIFAAGMGLLIGVFAQNEDQVVILTLIPMFILSGLGGAWVPLEFTSETVQRIGHISPVAWMMDGFKNILVRGQGLDGVWLPAGVLLAFGVTCFTLAAWRFRRE